MMWEFRYVERTISHQFHPCLYICNGLFTFVRSLSRFSAPRNVRQQDLSKSPPNPPLVSEMKSYVIWEFRYVERTISHQFRQCLYICNGLFTFVRSLSRFSAPRNVRQQDLSKSPPNPPLVSEMKSYVIWEFRYVDRTISHQFHQCLYICNGLFTFGRSLSRFSAPRNVRQQDLSKSPPNPPSFRK